jgi:hypothetical protein
MKIFQEGELILPMKAIKGLQKNGIIQAIKHVFVWCVIYEQCVVSMSLRISRKENVEVLVENWLVKFI